MKRRNFLLMIPAIAAIRKIIQKPTNWVIRLVGYGKRTPIDTGNANYKAWTQEMHIEIQPGFEKYFNKPKTVG